MERESFIFYRSFASIQSLKLKERDWMVWTIVNYALDGTEPDWDKAPNKAVLEILWNTFRPVIDANTRKFLAGKKGGAPVGSRNNPNGRRGNQELTTEKPRTNQDETKNLTNIKEKEKEKDKVKGVTDIEISASEERTSEVPAVPQKHKITGTQQVLDLWNSTVKETGASLPLVVKLTEARKKKIQVRWKEFAEVGNPEDVMRKIFENACGSKFFQGDNKTGWSGSFDWLFENSKNWVKTYEGNYDNRNEKPSNGNGFDRLHITAASAEDYEGDF